MKILGRRRDQWIDYDKRVPVEEVPYEEVDGPLDDLALKLKEQHKLLKNTEDPRERMNVHSKLRVMEREYFRLRGKIAIEKMQKKEQEKAKVEELQKQKLTPGILADSFTIDLTNAVKDVQELESLEQVLHGSNAGWQGDPPMTVEEPKVKLSDGSSYSWNPSYLGSTSDTVKSTINPGDLSGYIYGASRPGRSRESEILNKHTQNMAKGKLPKIIYELVMNFEMNPSKGILASLFEQLNYPTPWPSFDSIKGISINNDKIVIETYDSESEVDRDLFDSANGFGHGIQPPRHKKSEPAFDKLVKPKGPEVALQPRRVFKSGRTLRLSD